MNSDFYESEQAQSMANAYERRQRDMQYTNFNPLVIILVAILFMTL
ncbi:MAG: hypothetical protein LBQ05_00350 [Christensenellaceae bacterium]|jgi:hypothetical protein|nr:hypothetical protein [Christensenellaceae bacterium]